MLGQQPVAPPPAAPAPATSLDYDFYEARVQPLFTEKRVGHARCVTCHAGSTTLRLQRLSPGATAWNEEQTRQNFEAVHAMVVPGSPGASKLLRHPLARAAGGDVFHGGGQHWTTKDDPDWRVLAAWVNGATLASWANEGLQGAPAHGLGITPDGKILFATSKIYSQLYAYSLPDLKPIGSVHVGQHPEWVTFSPDGKFVDVAAAGDNAVSVVNTATLKEIARIPVGQTPKRNSTALLRQ